MPCHPSPRAGDAEQVMGGGRLLPHWAAILLLGRASQDPEQLTQVVRAVPSHLQQAGKSTAPPYPYAVWKILSQTLKHITMMQDVQNGQHLKCFLIG